MKSFVSLMVVGVMFLAGVSAYADDARSPFDAFRPEAAPAKASSELNLASLKQMLNDMGIKAEPVDFGNSQGLVVKVNHTFGTRFHLIGINAETKTIIMMVTEETPEAANAGVEWYRKVCFTNVKIHPQVIGVTGDKTAFASVLGNVNVTPKALENFITKHLVAVEKVFRPLISELNETEAPAPAPF